MGESVCCVGQPSCETHVEGRGCGVRVREFGEVLSFGRGVGEARKRLVFVWVPGHGELIGNEWTTKAAGEATPFESGWCGVYVR